MCCSGEVGWWCLNAGSEGREQQREAQKSLFFPPLHFSAEAWKQIIFVIWQQRKQEVFQTFIFTFSLFFWRGWGAFVKCSPRRARGITFIWDICFIWNHFKIVGLTYLVRQGEEQSEREKKKKKKVARTARLKLTLCNSVIPSAPPSQHHQPLLHFHIKKHQPSLVLFCEKHHQMSQHGILGS